MTKEALALAITALTKAAVADGVDLQDVLNVLTDEMAGLENDADPQ